MPASFGDAQRPRVSPVGNPARGYKPRTERRAEDAGEMWTALGPIHALPREATPRVAQFINIDAQIRKPALACGSKLEVPFPARSQYSVLLKAASQLDSNSSGQVVVAGAREI